MVNVVLLLLVFPDSLAELVKAVCHDGSGRGDVEGWSEATDGKVALILDWLIAAHRRHILGHICGGLNDRIGHGKGMFVVSSLDERCG